MRKYRTFDQVEEEYYREHPEEIDSFLTVIFEEYAKDNDTGALLSALCMISRVKAVTAEAAGMSQQKLHKVLSEQGKPLGSPLLCVITHAYGFMESFHSNPFAIIFSRLVITVKHFPHS